MAGEDDEEDGPDEKFTSKFNALFHKAMSEREKRFESKIFKRLDESLGKSMDELKTLIMSDDADEQEQPQPGQQPPPGQTPGHMAQLPPEVAAQIKRAERDAKEAKEAASKFELEAKAEKSKAQRSEEATMLTQMLTGRVKPALLDVVVKDLHARIQRDEDNPSKILWKGDDDQLLPLKDGVDGWSKTDYAKEVAPPREARGGGGRGPEGGRGSGKDGAMTLEDFGAALADTMGRSQ